MQLFWTEFSNIINRNVLQGFSLLFKDVLFGFFNIQKDQINEYFIINLLLLAKFHIHRSLFMLLPTVQFHVDVTVTSLAAARALWWQKRTVTSAVKREKST